MKELALCLFQDLATALDDGTAGEMVASCNYWGAMRATTSKTNSEQFKKQSTSKLETGAGGDGIEKDACSTPATFGGVEWAAIHLESGNVKVEALASAAEVSYLLACSHERTQPNFSSDRYT